MSRNKESHCIAYCRTTEEMSAMADIVIVKPRPRKTLWQRFLERMYPGQNPPGPIIRLHRPTARYDLREDIHDLYHPLNTKKATFNENIIRDYEDDQVLGFLKRAKADDVRQKPYFYRA